MRKEREVKLQRVLMIFLLATGLVFSLTGCGGSDGDTAPTEEGATDLTLQAQESGSDQTQLPGEPPSPEQLTPPTSIAASPTPTEQSAATSMAQLPTLAIPPSPGDPLTPGASTGTALTPNAETSKTLDPSVPTLPVLPTSTALVLATKPLVPDMAQWVSNNPADGSTLTIDPDVRWDMIWKVKNSGTTTWTTKYTLRYFNGERLQRSVDSIAFPREVKPGEIVTLTVPAKTPYSPGDAETMWALTNENGQNFYYVTLKIKLIQ
jgi:hypothetical protein